MFDDPVVLARAQFGLNIAFHILFPSITIALGWFLLYLRIRANRTGEAWVEHAYRLWVKIFALSFGLGVVSGITMSFQFGTNWPGYMEKVGNVAGPLLGYEVLTAFFLEATFLGVMLFGRDRVPQWLHTLAAALVAIGTTASAFWILALNSWMQTPQGHVMIDGEVHAADWLAIIFNPSFPYRLTHMLIASGLTASFLVAGLSAFQLLRNAAHKPARGMVRIALLVAAVLAPTQAVVGDFHGLNTLEHQPAKIAAIEGIWEGGRNVPLLLFAIPNEAERRNDYAIGIPSGASWILRHSADGELPGLNQFEGQHPPVLPVFWSFRVMVGIGVLMIAAAWYGAWRTRRRGFELPRWFMRVLAAMTFSGWIAVVAGWLVTEIGRQPWLVHGVLTTAEAASNVAHGSIAISFTAYALVYVLLLTSFMVVVTQLGLKDAEGEHAPTEAPKPLRPLAEGAP
jgi:cytochrome d ubiquinol oxidase subunit I